MSDAPSHDQAEGPNPFSLSSSRKEGDPGAVQDRGWRGARTLSYGGPERGPQLSGQGPPKPDAQ